ncbi:ABC transporter ATP-binding protein [Amycolatopsis sp.]|uniref:ABC transporter ATP-binding protein n=1 Tax=Amycolatopsis sp. TaxID=37632 RepID=UPI002BFFED59|nr:ABC transporter ATP-binding protein [Amycolatopsis sp.]HVV08394.1 ABC transporter ATP-binding protein [Amycolatopsis sp.]
MNGEPLLTVTDLTVRYGGVVAVDNVSLTVPTGKIVGLIGPNGAGKTTLVDALTGFVRCSGTVSFRGVRIDRLRAHLRARHGIARTFQAGGIFDDLTVRENILIGERRPGGWWSTVRAIVTGRGEHARPETRALVGTLGLGDLLGVQASELSSGQRKLVSVAQALAGGPELVLLDEPAAGLDSTESAWLGERLRAVRDSGVTMLLVDHDMELVVNVCDEIVVLDFGKVIAAGEPQETLAQPQVITAYLGSVTAATEGDAA